MLQVLGMRRSKHQWMLLQLADSAFPAGAFAHSGGLEAAWQLGRVQNGTDFRRFLESQRLQLTRSQLPFVHAAYIDPSNLVTLDAECHALLNSPVARRASIAQGQAFAMAAAKTFADRELVTLASRFRLRELHGHWSPAFGALSAALGLDVEEAAMLFLFLNLRGIISAAVRLGIVGPFESQAIQHEILAGANGIELGSEPAQTSPILDLWQGLQDRLYSRLFQT